MMSIFRCSSESWSGAFFVLTTGDTTSPSASGSGTFGAMRSPLTYVPFVDRSVMQRTPSQNEKTQCSPDARASRSW